MIEFDDDGIVISAEKIKLNFPNTFNLLLIILANLNIPKLPIQTSILYRFRNMMR